MYGCWFWNQHLSYEMKEGYYAKGMDCRIRRQIGTAINRVLDPMEMEVFNTDKNELDITQTDEVLRFGEINRPNIIINCAAITDTALCEQEPELAFASMRSAHGSEHCRK